MGIFHDRGKVHWTICAACRDDKAEAVLIGGRAGSVGAEMGLRVVPDQLATAMRPQVHHRGPAARHGDRITGDLFQYCAFASLGTDRHAGDTLAAFDRCDAFAVLNPNAQATRLFGQCPAAVCTGV